jgi:DNA-binding beta-propeller fold protein YncE
MPLWLPAGGDIEQVRGIAAHAASRRLFVSTVKRLAAIDLNTEKIVWEKSFDGHGCDRFAVSPDGRTIYAPAFGSPKWYVVDASTGDAVATVPVQGWPRDTRYLRDGKLAFLAAWESTVLSVADTASHKIIRTVGPFSSFVCPFTVNAKGTLAFANVDGLVGFEVADLQTGLILDSVPVEGVSPADAGRFECPSHGIAFTPDERELWVADGVNNRLHVFDATVYPPTPLAHLNLEAQPRWITFSIDGHYGYASSGEVIDASARKIVGALKDDRETQVRSEKMVEVDW